MFGTSGDSILIHACVRAPKYLYFSAESEVQNYTPEKHWYDHFLYPARILNESHPISLKGMNMHGKYPRCGIPLIPRCVSWTAISNPLLHSVNVPWLSPSLSDVSVKVIDWLLTALSICNGRDIPATWMGHLRHVADVKWRYVLCLRQISLDFSYPLPCTFKRPQIFEFEFHTISIYARK